MKGKRLLLSLGLLIVFVMSFASLTVLADTAGINVPPPLLYGDLNFDFVCDSADYSILNRYLLGKIDKFENPQYKKYADLNSDGEIDSADYNILRRYLLGLIKALPYTDTTITPTITLTPTITITATPSISITPSPTKELPKSLEIERKFLIKVDKIPYDLNTFDKYALTQKYVSFSPEIRVRKVNDDMYLLGLKIPVDPRGMIREEHEFFISEEEYLALYKKTEGNVITKDRYQGLVGKYIYAIDIYTGMFKGLAVLEVGFESEEEANSFIPPDWIEKDVTSDKRYKNGNLAKYGLQDIEL